MNQETEATESWIYSPDFSKIDRVGNNNLPSTGLERRWKYLLLYLSTMLFLSCALNGILGYSYWNNRQLSHNSTKRDKRHTNFKHHRGLRK